jgi:hypothetical protein
MLTPATFSLGGLLMATGSGMLVAGGLRELASGASGMIRAPLARQSADREKKLLDVVIDQHQALVELKIKVAYMSDPRSKSMSFDDWFSQNCLGLPPRAAPVSQGVVAPGPGVSP